MQVVDPTYVQRLMRLPPVAAQTSPAFVHDYFNSFTSILFLGNEGRLFLFETIFFCAVDMDLQNVPLTALLTFITSEVISWITNKLAIQNLEAKTMVDSHFII